MKSILRNTQQGKRVSGVKHTTTPNRSYLCPSSLKFIFYKHAISFYVLFISLFSSYATSSASTAPTALRFQKLLEEQQIVIGAIHEITQDHLGFIWIGGDEALVRYDGYEFREYGISSGDDFDIRSIYALLAHEKSLWIGTADGLFEYDLTTESTKHHSSASDSEFRIVDDFILDITHTAKNELLIATSKGLSIVDLNTRKVTNSYTPQSHPDFLPSGFVEDVLIDKNNVVWAATNAGLGILDRNNRTSKIYRDSIINEQSISDKYVRTLCLDAQNNLWVGTRNGLNTFNQKTGQFKHFFHSPHNENSLSSNSITTIAQGPRGYIWVGTDQGGLNIYDQENDTFIRYKQNGDEKHNISTNVLRSIFFDRQGDAWLGHYPNGLSYVDKQSNQIKRYQHLSNKKDSLSFNYIWSITEDAKGNFWIGTDGGGLNYFDREKQHFEHFKSDPLDQNSPSVNAILDTHIDKRGLLWLGTWGGGLSTYDTKTKKFTRLKTSASGNGPSSHNVWQIYEDKTGILWFGTHRKGLNKYDPTTGKFEYLMLDSRTENNIPTNIIWTMFEDSKDRFWVAGDSTLSILDRKSKSFKHYHVWALDPDNSSGTVFTIFEDSKKRLWFGTNQGLFLFQEETENFTLIGQDTTFKNEAIRGILEDKNNHLWLATNDGIVKLNPETGAVRSFRHDKNWISGRLNYNAVLTTKRGEFVFGGDQGFTIFNPDSIESNPHIPTIAITDFKIFEKAYDRSVQGKKTPAYLSEIQLNHKQNMFSIEFTALNFRSPQKNEFAYMLEGFDEDWLYPQKQRKAVYTNLDPGTYTFKVKGSNNDGAWNHAGTSIKIVKLAPPWRSWWAYICYLLITIAAICKIVTAQLLKQREAEEQALILEHKVAARTAEINEKNEDIQSMLSSMSQGLFTIEKGGKINKEYSKYLEEIFETENIANSSYIDILFGNCDLESNRIELITQAIDTMLGNDELNFQFNSHLLIRNLTIKTPAPYHRKKHLELTWNPVQEKNIIKKVMVAVRDITVVKQLENEALSKKRELDIIGQVLKCEPLRFSSYIKSAKNLIATNRQIIENQRFDLNQLFRRMHTLKGSSRTLGFSYISELAHQAESNYAKIQIMGKSVWKDSSLLADLDKIEKMLDEYAHVFTNVLGNNTQAQQNDGTWIPQKILNKFYASTNSETQQTLNQILALSDSLLFEELIADTLKSLPNIAIELNKVPPTVAVDAKNIYIKKSEIEPFNNIFTHILNNSLDHGIESAEQRQAKNKPNQGKITIGALPVGDQLQIFIEDDGQGLDLTKLAKLAIKDRDNQETENLSADNIDRLFFEPGVTTKENATLISGRGVGMHTVKELLQEMNAQIKLELKNYHLGQKHFCAFRLVITLPSDMFAVLNYTANMQSPEFECSA